jgi:membrane protein DedA with SNARE-associated domain
MSASVTHFITAYGYWAIFWLIFLQEIGVPNPISNEFVLLFSGSMAYTGLLSFPLIFLTAVFADFLGATVLYVVFLFFGRRIENSKWMPIPKKRLEQFKDPIERYGKKAVFFGRLLPFARGYAAVAAGLLNMAAWDFFMVISASALIWSGGFVTLGAFFGRYVANVERTTKGIEEILLAGILITVIILILRYYIKNKKKATP